MVKIMKVVLKTTRTVCTAILYLLAVISAVSLVQTVVSRQEMPLLFGFGKALVITGSMEPAIIPGDMIIFQEREEYESGDIVIYKANSYITHRIVEVTEDGYITQGDANNTADDEIVVTQVVGKVIFRIPGIGYLTEFITSPLGILILLAAFAAIRYLPDQIGKFLKWRGAR